MAEKENPEQSPEPSIGGAEANKSKSFADIHKEADRLMAWSYQFIIEANRLHRRVEALHQAVEEHIRGDGDE